SAKVGTVKLDGDVVQKIADSTSFFTYTAQVVDGNGNPVRKADLVVNWTQDKGSDVTLSAATTKTDVNGQATVTLKSTTKAVDNITVSAQYEDTAKVAADKTVSFIYELSSAKVGTVKLDGDVVQKIADSTSFFTYTAQVVDGNGNPVRKADLVVNWTQNKGSDVTLSAATTKTDVNGQATVTLKSTTKAVDNITVSAQYESTAAVAANKVVSFIADENSATISAYLLDNGKMLTPADGTTNYKISILVKDRYGNALKNYSVTVTSLLLTEPRILSTDINGEVITEISSLIAGSSDVLITSTANLEIKTNVTLKYSIAKLNIVSPYL
ncbi:Ig-like domain-containing protein, partial [Morganella morganii]|uniref:Ig-like domain-containing protein n=1 Tax=Morganella morganii TaxID=582 RepID=UPI003EC6B7FE